MKKLMKETVVGKFNMNMKEACSVLGVSTTTMKKYCRHELGIKRWPFRKVASYLKKIEQCKTQEKNPQLPVSKKKKILEKRLSYEVQLNNLLNPNNYGGDSISKAKKRKNVTFPSSKKEKSYSKHARYFQDEDEEEEEEDEEEEEEELDEERLDPNSRDTNFDILDEYDYDIPELQQSNYHSSYGREYQQPIKQKSFSAQPTAFPMDIQIKNKMSRDRTMKLAQEERKVRVMEEERIRMQQRAMFYQQHMDMDQQHMMDGSFLEEFDDYQFDTPEPQIKIAPLKMMTGMRTKPLLNLPGVNSILDRKKHYLEM